MKYVSYLLSDDIYKPERDGSDEPDWLQSERDNFKSWDVDGDGRLNRKELTSWVVPTHYDPYESEAAHLIHDVDTNEVNRKFILPA